MPQKPRADKGQTCPLLKQDMGKVCHKCPLWVHVRGTNPQGGEVDQWACSFSWLPMLLLENSQQQRQTAAAVESLRNAAVDKTVDAIAGLHAVMTDQLRLLQAASQMAGQRRISGG